MTGEASQRAFVLWTSAPEEGTSLRHVFDLTLSLDELYAREDYCQFHVETEYGHGILDVDGDEEYEGFATDVAPDEAKAFVARFEAFFRERDLLVKRHPPLAVSD